MNLHIYRGLAGTGKTQACFQDVARLLKEGAESILYLVPDPATYEMERALAEALPQRGFTTVRVVGFSRFAYQIFQSLGQVESQGLSTIGQRLLLQQLMREGSEEFPLLGQAMRQPRFADIMQTVVRECKAFRVGAEDLIKASKAVSSTVLSHKLDELGRLMSAYDERVDELFGLHYDRMEALIEAVPKSPLVKDAYVFVDGFHWFTPQQMAVVEAMIGASKSLTMTLCLPTDAKELKKQAKKTALFARPYELYCDLKEKYGSFMAVRDFAEPRRFQTEALAAMAASFTGGKAAAVPMRMIEGYDRQEEMNAICREILRLVEEEGRRWRDCMIVLRDETTYADYLEKALGRYEIPYFTDRRNPMITHPLAEYIVSLFETVEGCFSHDPLFRLLKTDLFPLERQAVDRLENYCLAQGIKDRLWLVDAWDFSQYGSRDKRLGGDEEMNGYKDVIMGLLRPFWDWAKSSHRGEEWCDALMDLLVAMDVPKRLEAWCQEAEEAQNPGEALGHEKMYNKLMTLFQEIATISGDRPLKAREIKELLQDGLAEVTYSTVPPSLDHVTVTTIDRSYMREGCIVFVAGLNEGLFPKRLGDEGIIKDAERKALKAVGLTLADGALANAFTENLLLYLAMTRAKEEVIASYARSDADGAGLTPSLCVRRWEQQGFGAVAIRGLLTTPPEEEESLLWRVPQAVGLLALALGKGEGLTGLWPSLYLWLRDHDEEGRLNYVFRGQAYKNVSETLSSDYVSALLMTRGELRSSVTRFESYNRCPFSFYAAYVLGLQPRAVKEYGAPEIGTFLHEALYRVGKGLLDDKQTWNSVEDIEDRSKKALQETLDAHPMDMVGKEAYMEYVAERLGDTFTKTVNRMVDWANRSTFVMGAVEYGFGRGKAGSEALHIPLDSTSLRLEGCIDRVDFADIGGRRYGLVTDYKSGGTTMSLCELYYGLALQLPTYMLLMERDWREMPYFRAIDSDFSGESLAVAGFMYSYVRNDVGKAKNPVSEEDSVSYIENKGNRGYVSNVADVWRAIDDKMVSKEYIPLAFKKDLSLSARSVDQARSEGDFDVIGKYAALSFEKAGRRIMDGDFPIRPVRHNGQVPCTFCQYKAFCRFDSRVDKYNSIKDMTDGEAMDCMRKEVYGDAVD